jgi:RNA polymerase sigma factor (TIGR02999 family)
VKASTPAAGSQPAIRFEKRFTLVVVLIAVFSFHLTPSETDGRSNHERSDHERGMCEKIQPRLPLASTSAFRYLLWAIGMTGSPSITRLLIDWSNGDRAALDELTPHVYRELHTLARTYLSRNRRKQTLQPTALINEVYLRLIDQSQPIRWESRSHFFGIAARLMRLILVDHARTRLAGKRGRDAVAVTIEDTAAFSPGPDAPGVLEVDQVLRRLEKVDERKARIIEFRYFAGMTHEEIAGASGLSVPTVMRELRLAEAWLRHHLMSQS